MMVGYELDNLLISKLTSFKLSGCKHLNDEFGVVEDVKYELLDTIDDELAADKHGFNRDDILYDYAKAIVQNIYDNLGIVYSEYTVNCVTLDVYVLLCAGCIFSDKLTSDNVISTRMIVDYLSFIQSEHYMVNNSINR